ncbi:MAG TPA: hypothetical protein VFS54_01920 [Solirubrobacterales bacterium]|nr:hypothetical protein [Solirubrobacterales bacterium]
MEIYAKDLYFLERALKEPARQETKVAQSGRSPILQKFACPHRQAEALKASPHGQRNFSASSCSPPFTTYLKNVEPNCVEPNCR